MGDSRFATQVVVMSTGNEVGLAALTGIAGSSVLLKALPANAADLYLGVAGFAGSADGFPLGPGDWVGMDIQDANKAKFRGTTGDKVAVLVTSP